MDKVKKYLLKIGSKDRVKILTVLKKIEIGKTKNLDIKQLRGYPDILRVRVGNHKIIYQNKGDQTRLLSVGRRNDDTYKNLYI